MLLIYHESMHEKGKWQKRLMYDDSLSMDLSTRLDVPVLSSSCRTRTSSGLAISIVLRLRLCGVSSNCPGHSTLR